MALASRPEDLPAAVAQIVHPGLHHLRPELGKLSLQDHATKVCELNATDNSNLDALPSPIAFCASSALKSPGGCSLPLRRSLFNHSCRGNVVTFHMGGEVFVRTIRGIDPGEELCLEYLAGLPLLQSTEERRGLLAKKWGFTCMCSRCVEAEGCDPYDVEAGGGWEANAKVAIQFVNRGTAGADELVRSLIGRQRERAGGKGSYAELKLWHALAWFFGQSQDYKQCVAAIANMREMVDGILPANHPARIPYLIADAIYAPDRGTSAVDEARRVHDIAHGKQENLFDLRWRHELELITSN